MNYFSFAFLVVLALSCTTYAQDKKFTYIQFEITMSITGNPDLNEPEDYQGQKRSWFIPDGLGSKLGYGIHYKQWCTLGIHSGLDWKWNEQLVAVPVYLNFGLSPKIGEDTRLTMQLSYGKSFALGRGHLSGDYKKARLGLTGDDRTLFIEIADYGFPLHQNNSVGSISLGISLISF